jgi:cysteine desulfurase/selenocysteine lyase
MRRIGMPATARASFYVYSDGSDVDVLGTALEAAQLMFAEG